MRRSARLAAAGTLAWWLSVTPTVWAWQQTANTTAAAPLEIPGSDVPQLRAVLTDAGSGTLAREQAAQRLVDRNTPEAIDALRRGLTDLGNPEAQLAVARALAADPSPKPTLIDPLFALLEDGARRPLLDAATRALSLFKSNPEVLPRLIAVLQRARSEPLQMATLRALGSFVDRRAAEALMSVLTNPDRDPALQRAAADALTYMTGDTTRGRASRAWQEWWVENRDLSDVEFRSRLLLARSTRYDLTRWRYDALTEELSRTLAGAYAATPAEAKPEFALRLLRAEQPAIRAAAADLVLNDFRLTGVAAPEIRAALRTLIGDADADVRRNVARTLRDLNDADSLVPLLTQVRQERDPQVRSALLSAIAPIRDVRGVPILLEMLDDPSPETAASAASALAEMGDTLRGSVELRDRVTVRLRDTLERRTGPTPAMIESLPLREAILSAMVPLRDASLAPVFLRVLNVRPRESVRARRAVIMALGELGNIYAPVLAEQLEDDEAAVRLESVKAIAKTANSFEYGEALRRRLDPALEPDPSVRAEAWRALQAMLPLASPQQLAPWVDRFRDDPERRRIVLLRLADLAEKAGDADELASRQQQIGDTYMAQRQPADAAPWFYKALDYSVSAKAPTAVLLSRAEATIDAMLGARLYPEAASLAGRMIALNPNEFVTSMGGKIAMECDRLVQADELEAAQRLLLAARDINPPLPGRLLERLRETEAELQRRLAEKRGR